MRKNLYSYDNIMHILHGEEKKGHLKDNTYSEHSGVRKISNQMKELRLELRKQPRTKQEDLKLQLKQLQKQYKEKTQVEQEVITNELVHHQFRIAISKTSVKDHETYTADNCQTTIVSKIISQELQRGYKIKPQNRDLIVEQICGLLDGSMAKVVIRADVKEFFESIPQKMLLDRLTTDGFLSAISLKYLRSFMFQYNGCINNTETKRVGIPRGLSFSSYLSEVFMMPIDDAIMKIPGVCYYKRYVDDVILIANPNVATPEEYRAQLMKCFEGSQLELHSEPTKWYMSTWKKDTQLERFVYLGYQFNFNEGKLNVCLSPKRYNKYLKLLDAVFAIYAQCSHYRRQKAIGYVGEKKIDALHQLMLRLRVLTGNGLLSGRKNYVATGVYYTNKYITDTYQLAELDEHLRNIVDNPKLFCPPTNLFNYVSSGYEENVMRIKEVLKSFSFVESFTHPILMRNAKYSLVQTNLQRIYNSLDE